METLVALRPPAAEKLLRNSTVVGLFALVLVAVFPSLSKAQIRICRSAQQAVIPSLAQERMKSRIYGNAQVKTPDDLFDQRSLENWARESVSIETFLAQLPLSLRRDYTLMMNSKSSQFGSALEPRVLMTNSDSSFVMTFSTAEKQRGFEGIEVIIFNPQKRRYTTYEIRFEDQKGVIEKDPKRCRGCHGVRTRPIWDSYPFWPGAYGGGLALPKRAGEMLPQSRQVFLDQEAGLFAKLLENWTSSRLRALPSFPDVREYHEINNALTLNFAEQRRRQIHDLVDGLAQKDPNRAGILSLVMRSLGHTGHQAEDIGPLLSAADQRIYKAEFVQIQKQVVDLLNQTRARKVIGYYQDLGLPVPNPQSLWNKDSVPFSDLDLSVLTHNYATARENQASFEKNAKKYAQLYFVWVRLLGRNLDELNLARNSEELPALATPNINAWQL
jgi:hypothetical protein